MSSALALSGALIVGFGGVVTALPGRLRPGLAMQALGIALLGASGAGVLSGGEPIGAAFREGASPALGLDPLSGFFLLLLALTAVPTLLYARAYLHTDAAS